MVESSLSFLGLGVQPPTPSWGNMLLGRQRIPGNFTMAVRLPRPGHPVHRAGLQSLGRIPARFHGPAQSNWPVCNQDGAARPPGPPPPGMIPWTPIKSGEYCLSVACRTAILLPDGYPPCPPNMGSGGEEVPGGGGNSRGEPLGVPLLRPPIHILDRLPRVCYFLIFKRLS